MSHAREQSLWLAKPAQSSKNKILLSICVTPSEEHKTKVRRLEKMIGNGSRAPRVGDKLTLYRDKTSGEHKIGRAHV